MILVADIGGTNTRIAIGDAHGTLEEPVLFDTPRDLDAALAVFARTAQELAHGLPITAGAIGIAGLLSRDRTTLLRAPHLQGWTGKNLSELFSRAINAPVRLENDAALGGLGEARYGAGVGASIVAFVAVGTGIGGARITDGIIDRSSLGFEIGHQRLGQEVTAPEWEELASGSGLEKIYRRPTIEINDAAAWEACADNFALGLYNTILHWSPDRVVLGGSLFNKGVIPLQRVLETLQSATTALPELPEFAVASLGDRSGLYGGLALAQATTV